MSRKIFVNSWWPAVGWCLWRTVDPFSEAPMHWGFQLRTSRTAAEWTWGPRGSGRGQRSGWGLQKWLVQCCGPFLLCLLVLEVTGEMVRSILSASPPSLHSSSGFPKTGVGTVCVCVQGVGSWSQGLEEPWTGHQWVWRQGWGSERSPQGLEERKGL